MTRLLAVDQTNIPVLQAEAKYAPFMDSARAVVAPIQSSFVKAIDFDQVLFEIAIISAHEFRIKWGARQKENHHEI